MSPSLQGGREDRPYIAVFCRGRPLCLPSQAQGGREDRPYIL
jgi:hypothetical protein